MIKANELRLNNWVNISGSYIQLAGEKFLYILEQDGMFTRCDGIPLTPEILEKAGFEVDDLGYHKIELEENGNIMGIWLDDAIWVYNARSTQYNEITLTLPKYLHQLQNLYFALTGSELEINLTKVDTPAQLQ